MKKQTLYCILNLTWGLPLTLIGLIAAIGLMLIGKRPKKYFHCYLFEIGNGWGGLNLGLFVFTSKTAGTYTRTHELGHSIQNAKYGPATLFIVAIPSMVRYWYRSIREKMGLENPTGYYDIWFESEATALGQKFFKELE